MICIVCALACEAGPIIRKLGLKQVTGEAPFSLYRGEKVAVVVSGVGRELVSMAMGFARGYWDGDSPQGWLNVGIAGHQGAAIGTPFLADSVSEPSGKKYYPAFTFKPPCATAPLTTFDQPDREYTAAGLYDMEGAGFYAAGIRFSTVERVHCLKVVSDNAKNPAGKMKRETVESLITSNLNIIQRVVESLENQCLPNMVEDCTPILTRWHFTQTERHQLEKVLCHWKACLPDKKWRDVLPDSLESAQEVLEYLTDAIEQHPLRFT